MLSEHLSKSLWYNNQLLTAAVDDLYEMVTNPLGVTNVEWHVLYVLYRQDGQRPSDLARMVGRTATSFTPVLDSLERKAWIARQADPVDRRAIRIHLTDQAHQNRARFEQSVTALETLLKAHVSEPDLRYLVQLREQLAEA